MKTTKIIKVVRIIAISIIGIGIFLALVTGGNFLFFWSIFNWFQNSIREITGMSTLLAKASAAIVTALIIIFPLGKVVMSFSPLPLKNKGLYRSFLFVGIAILFLFAYFGRKETYFNVRTGQALTYYSVLPDGEYKLYPDSGYDPITGDKLKVATKEIILKSKGLLPLPPPPISPEKVVKPVEAPVYIPSPPVNTPTPTNQTTDYKKEHSPAHHDYIEKSSPKQNDEIVSNTANRSVGLYNQSSAMIPIYDNHNVGIIDVCAGCKTTVQLRPGNYYYKKNSERKLFKVVVGEDIFLRFTDGSVFITPYETTVPEQVDPITGRPMTYGQSEVVELGPDKFLVNLSNKTGETIVILDHGGTALFTVMSGDKVQKKMEPGSYYVQNNFSKKKYFDVSSEKLSFEFFPWTNNNRPAAYNKPIRVYHRYQNYAPHRSYPSNRGYSPTYR